MINKVAIQGELGSFHHAAAKRWYGKNVIVVPCISFNEVFEVLNSGLANSAVVAIENSLYGSINEVYDLLLDSKFSIIGEVPERIHQCLIGFADTNNTDITHIYSHPVALAQCSNYLDEHLPFAKKVEIYDTAASAELVSKNNNHSWAAIGSALAAKMHGLSVLKSNIQNSNLNYTRFLVLQEKPLEANTNKASLVIQTNHQTGALYKVLGEFYKLDLNLSKLQSRPIPGKLWKYMFYIDVEATPTQLNTLIRQIRALKSEVIVLGLYNSSTNTTDI